jgi:hypothetical protein
MGGLEIKRKNLSQALKRFEEAIQFYQYGLEGKVNLIGPIILFPISPLICLDTQI